MMNPTDWKGNKIKAGDTIVIYRTEEPPRNSYRLIIFDFSEEKIIYSSPPTELTPPKKYTWYLVKEIGPLFESEVGLSFETEIEGMRLIIDIKIELFFCDDHEIVCIKGKSDSEEEYYNYYFK